MKRAACAGKAPTDARTNPDSRDPWFPGKGHSLNTGKMVCFTCPVRAECKDYKKRTGSVHGMWAGQIESKEEDEQSTDDRGDLRRDG